VCVVFCSVIFRSSQSPHADRCRPTTSFWCSSTPSNVCWKSSQHTQLEKKIGDWFRQRYFVGGWCRILISFAFIRVEMNLCNGRGTQAQE
jgi:hypothetical protein